MRDLNVSKKEFERLYIQGDVSEATAIKNSVYYLWADTKEMGWVVSFNGSIRKWPSNESVCSYLRIKAVEAELEGAA